MRQHFQRSARGVLVAIVVAAGGQMLAHPVHAQDGPVCEEPPPDQQVCEEPPANPGGLPHVRIASWTLSAGSWDPVSTSVLHLTRR
jgi:hypothetical protein